RRRAPGKPMTSGNALLGNVVLFGRMLRRAGLSIDTDQTGRFADVLALLGFDRRGDVKAAGRALFVRRREERAVYDAAFDLFWRRSTAVGAVSQALPRLRQQRAPRADVSFGADAPPGVDVTDVVEETVRVGASGHERLRKADFADLTPAEARDAGAMVAALRPRLPLRPSRRPRVGPRGRRLAGARGREGGGLERGNAHRREPARAQPPLGATHDPERSRGDHRVRRLGARRPGAARARDGDPAALVPPADLAGPARGQAGLRADHAGARGGSAVCGRARRVRQCCIARASGGETL